MKIGSAHVYSGRVPKGEQAEMLLPFLEQQPNGWHSGT